MRLNRRRFHHFPINGPEESAPVPIVGDAAIATKTTAAGRLIPLLILDTTDRPDLNEAIRIQSIVPSGDVEIVWGKLPKQPKHIALFLSFRRPTNRNAILLFELEKQGILIECILTAKGLYIQSGRPGDRLIHDLDRPKILIEIPDTGFRPHWDKLFASFLMKRFQKKGFSRKEAKTAVRDYLNRLREVVKFRSWS